MTDVMATKEMPCPMCGVALEVVLEPRRLQLIDGRFVVEVGLSSASQEHVEAHRAPSGPNPMIPDTRKATKAENDKMKNWEQ